MRRFTHARGGERGGKILKSKAPPTPPRSALWVSVYVCLWRTTGVTRGGCQHQNIHLNSFFNRNKSYNNNQRAAASSPQRITVARRMAGVAALSRSAMKGEGEKGQTFWSFFASGAASSPFCPFSYICVPPLRTPSAAVWASKDKAVMGVGRRLPLASLYAHHRTAAVRKLKPPPASAGTTNRVPLACAAGATTPRLQIGISPRSRSPFH